MGTIAPSPDEHRLALLRVTTTQRRPPEHVGTPLPFLTMTVSLEAIFLALFVLASQNRLTRQADKRSHLDLQIDLLAEREMTAVLQLLQDIAQHLAVQTSVTPEQLRDLMKKTDLGRLTNRLEELAEPATSAIPDEPEVTSADLKAAS